MSAELANKIIPLPCFSAMAMMIPGVVTLLVWPDEWYWRALLGIAFALGFAMFVCICIRVATA